MRVRELIEWFFSLLATFVVNFSLICFVIVILVAIFFVWLNMRDLKSEEGSYHPDFNPSDRVKASIVKDEDADQSEPDPVEALKAWAHPQDIDTKKKK